MALGRSAVISLVSQAFAHKLGNHGVLHRSQPIGKCRSDRLWL